MTKSKGLARTEPEVPRSAMQRALDEFVPKRYPTTIDLWRIVLQIPSPPEFSAGGLAIPDEYRDRQEFAMYVGYVSQVGPLAYTAVTKGGIDLAKANKCKVGDWVQIGKHAGEKFRLRDGTLFIVIAESEVLGVVDPMLIDEFECLQL